MALTPIQECRLAVADLDPAIPFLSDESYQHMLDKNGGSVSLASLDAARTIMLLLSQRTSQTVDVLSISGTAESAKQYRLSLQMFLKDPQLNPILRSATAWAGGISKSDMQANIDNTDNNAVLPPASVLGSPSQADPTSSVSNPFLI